MVTLPRRHLVEMLTFCLSEISQNILYPLSAFLTLLCSLLSGVVSNGYEIVWAKRIASGTIVRCKGSLVSASDHQNKLSSTAVTLTDSWGSGMRLSSKKKHKQ